MLCFSALFVLVVAKYTQCSLFSDETECHCVAAELCPDSNTASSIQGLLDIRFEDNPCPNRFEVCCDEPLNYTELPQKPKKCGMPNKQNLGVRITSDSELTRFGELPWTVIVFDTSKSDQRNSFICGGSLIHPQVVITAGHCVASRKSNSLKVRAGEWNIRNNDEPLPHQEKFVKEILLHPHYRGEVLWNDVALLVLDQPLTISENIGFICLPTRNSRIDAEGGKCVASGWGQKAFAKGRHSKVLRKVKLPIVPRNKCQTMLRTTRLGRLFKLHRSFICAGGEKNKDTCKGDGGSPLICPLSNEERFVQVGIVSWGIGCGTNNTPGVYVNVALFTDWIDRQMKARNFDTAYYKP